MTVREARGAARAAPDIADVLASGRFLGLLLAAGVVLRVAWVLLADLRSLSFRTTDDAYYYFQVARNFTHGRGLTFDGMHPTNGFHPLWMALVLPLFAWSGDDPVRGLRAVQVLAALIAGGTLALVWRCVRDVAGPRAAFLVALLAVQPFVLYPLVNGLETGVLVLSLFVLVHSVIRRDLLAPGAGARRDAALGGLLGLAFLARLDSVFLLPALAAAIVLRAWRERGAAAGTLAAAARLARVGVVFLAASAPYLAWNRATFGHFVPISGALKSTFPRLSFEPGRLASFNTEYGLALLGASTLLLAGLALWREAQAGGGPPASQARARAITAVLWGGNVLHLAYSLAFVEWGTQWWHYVAYLPATLMAAALAFAEIDRRTGHRRVTFAVTVAAACVLLLAGAVVDRMRRGETRARWFDAMVWERDHLPPGAVLAMTDCGFVGYFGGHPVVNLDGVINGYAFQDALRRHRLGEFLRESGVSYVGNHRTSYVDGRTRIDLPARLAHATGGALVCTPDAEVYRSPEFPDEPLHPEHGSVRFVIWDLSRIRVVDDAATLDAAPPAPALPAPAPPARPGRAS